VDVSPLHDGSAERKTFPPHAALRAAMSLTELTSSLSNEPETSTGSPEMPDTGAFGAPVYEGPPQGLTHPPQLPEQEFWRWWLTHRPHLWSLGLRLMQGNRAEAEDVLSITALKAHANYPHLAHRLLKPREWLTTLLRNVCMDRYRERQCRGELLSTLDESHAQGLTLLPPGFANPEDQLCVQARLESLGVTLEDLPQGLRQPLLLRFVDGISYEEIALRMGLTQANVRKRIQLARARLRKLMKEE
jgi:RNA polymerase sigma-70 factor (ECF subfamily)